MSDIAISSQSNPIQNRFFEGQASQAKTLGSGHAKALGADPALADWYQQAYSYYQQVSSGAQAMPDADAWNEFLTQMNWAYEQLNGSSWDGGQMGGGYDPWSSEGDDFGGSQGYDPYGGMVGPSGNLIHNTQTADIGLLGGVTREIWSNEVNIHIPSLSAKIEAILTQDESVQPAETVLKILVTDPATGQTDTYIIHDYEDAKINALTPEAGQVQDTTGLLTWQEFSEASAPDVSEAVNHPVETLEDGSYLVEAPMGQGIDLTPPWDPNDTSAQTWELWGDFNLNLRPSDMVRVTEGSPNDPEGFTIKITRRNGQVITIHTHDGFKGNINANPENVNWGGISSAVTLPGHVATEAALDDHVTGTTGGTSSDPVVSDDEDDKTIPPEFAEHFTLNGQSSDDDAVEVAGDRPTRTEDGKRIWDGRDFDVYSRSDGKENLIYARGKVTLHASSNQEYWRVSWDAQKNAYIVEVYGDASFSADQLLESFVVDDMVDELVFDVDLSHLSFEEPLGAEFDDKELNTNDPHGAKITILGEEDKPGNSNTEWPSATIQSSIPSIDNPENARKLDLLILGAIKTDNWSSVQSYLIELQSKPEKANDAIRALIEAIYKAVGSDAAAFDKVMDLIPTEVRTQMVDAVTAKQGELNEADDTQWSNAVTASKILDTLDAE